jgi:hypothetical protein
LLFCPAGRGARFVARKNRGKVASANASSRADEVTWDS